MYVFIHCLVLRLPLLFICFLHSFIINQASFFFNQFSFTYLFHSVFYIVYPSLSFISLLKPFILFLFILLHNQSIKWLFIECYFHSFTDSLFCSFHHRFVFICLFIYFVLFFFLSFIHSFIQPIVAAGWNWRSVNPTEVTSAFRSSN